MPDLAMCLGYQLVDGSPYRTELARVCPRASDCYRVHAKPSPRQSYFATIPMKDDESCEYFMALRKT